MTPCGPVLINNMGNSSPPSYFWVSTTSSESSEAKVYRIKYLSKSGILREGACATAVLILLNVFFSTSVRLNCTLCFTIFYKGLTICAKSGTNLFTKFIVPINDFMPFLLWVNGIYSMDLILSRSMEIPFLEIT